MGITCSGCGAPADGGVFYACGSAIIGIGESNVCLRRQLAASKDRETAMAEKLESVVKVTDEYWQTLCHLDEEDCSTPWAIVRPAIFNGQQFTQLANYGEMCDRMAQIRINIDFNDEDSLEEIRKIVSHPLLPKRPPVNSEVNP